MTSRLSGVQQDVLSLYRRILREAMKKDRLEWQHRALPAKTDGSSSHTTVASSESQHPDGRRISFLELRGIGVTEQMFEPTTSDKVTTHTTTTAYAIEEFRKQAVLVQRANFKKIDYMIRKGDKQIKLLRMPGVKLVSSTTTAKSFSTGKQ